MDIFKAAEMFEKLAQQVVNLPVQVQMGSVVSTQQVKSVVEKLLMGYAKLYDQHLGYQDEVVLLPDNRFQVNVKVHSDVVDSQQLAGQAEKDLVDRLISTWPDRTFNVVVNPM